MNYELRMVNLGGLRIENYELRMRNWGIKSAHPFCLLVRQIPAGTRIPDLIIHAREAALLPTSFLFLPTASLSGMISLFITLYIP